MPRISHFYGISIYMYFNDHEPPHFHAEYAEHEGSFVVRTLEPLEGHLPRRAAALVIEWAGKHQEELMSNWEKAREGLSLDMIEPLK